MLINNISYCYNGNHSFALCNVNIKVQKGSVACLFGHSGCGKSTILKLITGIENPQYGSITINSKLVADRNQCVAIENRNVGLIFQHPTLFPHKTVVENIMFAIKSGSKKEKYSIALGILELLNMQQYQNVYPKALSGGQQQLVTIARVIAQSPDVALLDEPFASLDVLLKYQTRQYILSLLKSRNIPVLMVTHDPQEALENSDFIYIMKDGRIIQSGTPSSLPKNFWEVCINFSEVS
jgi:iron(III) transport system ATP-binding protein